MFFVQVSSCAGCDIFSPAEAVITGFIAGLIYTVLHHFMEYLEGVYSLIVFQINITTASQLNT